MYGLGRGILHKRAPSVTSLEAGCYKLYKWGVTGVWVYNPPQNVELLWSPTEKKLVLSGPLHRGSIEKQRAMSWIQLDVEKSPP